VVEYYAPLSDAYRRRVAGGGARARALERAVRSLAGHWNDIAFGPLRFESVDGEQRAALTVSLGALDPAHLRVELYADATATHPVESIEMQLAPVAGPPGTFACVAVLAFPRPPQDYTARVVPSIPDLSVPIECALISWSAGRT
jgi:starch phosphorylase